MENWSPLPGMPDIYVGLEYISMTNGRRHFLTMPGITTSCKVGESGRWKDGYKILAEWPSIDVQVFLTSGKQETVDSVGISAQVFVLVTNPGIVQIWRSSSKTTADKNMD